MQAFMHAYIHACVYVYACKHACTPTYLYGDFIRGFCPGGPFVRGVSYTPAKRSRF